MLNSEVRERILNPFIRFFLLFFYKALERDGKRFVTNRLVLITELIVGMELELVQCSGFTVYVSVLVCFSF